MSDQDKYPLRDALITEAINTVALQGLESFSLRTVSSAAGCSTAVVFQHFGSKDGLMTAALQQALTDEKNTHNHLGDHTTGVIFHHLGFADLIASYVELRSKSVTARFWSEVLFKSQQVAGAPAYLEQWHALRTQFWLTKLSQTSCASALAPIIAAYCAMEEVYAYSLSTHLEYRLLLRETTRALTVKGFGAKPTEYHSDISEWLGQGSPRFQVTHKPDRNALSERMLNLAAKHIITKSISSLNQRKIAKDAKTSSSMIAYHFGNLDAFVNEAIWRALVIDIPNEVNPAIAGGKKQKTMTEWSKFLSTLITRSQTSTKNAGFYINVARITGQASLLAQHRSEILPIIDHLRTFEGSGSYRASKTIWPSTIKIDRAAATGFGIWIKGQAILSEALSLLDKDNRSQLLDAATLLFAEA